MSTLSDVAGEKGEIRVRGWSVMSGYYDMPEKTAETLMHDGWLLTGDLGRLDAEGRLEFLGRLKNIIRVGGENASPDRRLGDLRACSHHPDRVLHGRGQ